MIGQLAWNLIWVKDLDNMRTFYGDALGLRMSLSDQSTAAFDTGPCILVLMARHDNGPAVMSDAQGWDRNKILFSFKVDDMDATLAELELRGVRPIAPPSPVVIEGTPTPRWRVAQFMDPEGNIVELCDEPVRWYPGLG